MRKRRYHHPTQVIPEGWTRVRKRKEVDGTMRDFADVLHELDNKYGRDNVRYVGSDARWFIFAVRESVLEAS